MLYPIVRPLATLAFRVFFRKIYITNAESLPKGKPTLLIANHPTTFTEPCILACFLDRPLYFLVRGDFFAHPIFSALLRDLHMIPIFRMKDGGYKGLRNNFTTFDACYEWLKENKTVMIMGEGSAYYEKRLRPLRKGPARIAMRTLERDPEMELYIVPVGVNYTDSNRFGSEAMIRFDEPFLASEIFGLEQMTKGKSVNRFTQRIREKLMNNIVIIDREEDEWLTERLLEVQRNEFEFRTKNKVEKEDDLLELEQRVANWINNMVETDRSVLKTRLKEYFRALSQHGITDQDLSKSVVKPSPLGMIIGFLPFAAGYLLNFLPLKGMHYIVHNKVIFNEFFGSVRIASSLGFFLIYYLLLMLFFFVGAGFKGLLIFSLFPLLGYFALRYWSLWEHWKARQNFRRMPTDVLLELKEERAALLAKIRGA